MTSRPRATRPSPDAGSALVLIPACTLILVVLAALATDLALVQLRRREALSVAASAANDAASLGTSEADLRQGLQTIDPGRATTAVNQHIATSDLSGSLARPPRVLVDGNTVDVVLAVEVEQMFSPAIPGSDPITVVTVRASATAVDLP